MNFCAVPRKNAAAKNADIAAKSSVQGVFYRISDEADYIGETNDQEGKYFNLEEYEQEIYG